MATAKPITIVGGGLAGLTLGIGLRQHGVPVTLWEAGRYPRHRVCGEFVSGQGQQSLERLGLLQLLENEGAIRAQTVEFCSATVAGRARQLPQRAVCLPRRQMDALLAGCFRKLGGELREGQRWRDSTDGEGVVMAGGRRLQPVVDGWRWFGLKAHATAAAMNADLEMHVLADGYVGLCRQPGGVVNVCGLFRRRPASGDAPMDWEEQLRGPAGSLLRERMRDARFAPDSFCAVAGINLRPQLARRQTDCRIGDALTMIPPFTGNGMSMAFESAEMAIEPLAAWSRNKTDWSQARQTIADRCDAVFAGRLRCAKWLQQMMMIPALQAALVTLTARNEWFWQTAFGRTR
ncbi:MAG: FAD-dependent monooxygenase [Verrucomicrobia bacterium]|nr:FAD-dependent monooxygenase [Verrucomicrobiota bacterium]